MFAAACKGSDEVTLWLRRRSMPTQGKPWENSQYGSSQMQGYPMAQHQQQAGGGAGSGGQGEGPWTFQPATVLATGGPLAQVVWGRGPGAQQDYLLTLGEDGSARVWIEQQSDEHQSLATERGTVKFEQAATIKSWYGGSIRLTSVGFVRWAYFGSHSRDLVHDEGSRVGPAYHLLHQQEQQSGGRPFRSDNWVVGCGDDGRRFLWSLKDMPLPDGRTFPEPIEVASLPVSWSVGISAPPGGAGAGGRGSSVAHVSAVGYYDAQSADGAPTELQVVARAAGGTIAVMTARVHRANPRGRFVFRNTRSVVLPLGQSSSAGSAPRVSNGEAGSSRKRGGGANVPGEDGGGHWDVDGIPHPNLPLIARLGGKGAWAVEVDSWVNGGSHLQCIPCKPREGESSQLGHTAGGEPERANGVSGSGSMNSDSSSDSSSGSSGATRKYRVAPVFGELAQKVRSGDELSFVPYSLPSLTLGCSECRGKEGAAKTNAKGTAGAPG
ncbi:unnamed protein product [Laminaria digitata]